MDQDTWKLVLEYLAAKESRDNVEIELLEQRLKNWVGNDADRQYKLEQALLIWEDTASLPEDESWKESFAHIRHQVEHVEKRKISIFKWWPAAVAATITGALLFLVFANQKTRQPVSQSAVAWITKTADPGKIISVMLPDSSEIWLNSGSSISFPDDLGHSAVRTVKLNGEAFFDVKKDPAHPFVVKSQQIRTKVLGTSFNIRAWKGHDLEVTVLTGKVAVSKDNDHAQSGAVYLLPNQKVSYNSKSAVLVRENVEDAKVSADWRTGKMMFDKTPIEDVFQAISRKYGVKVVADHAFGNCELTAKFDNVSLKEVMRTIELTFDVHYTINKQTIYIKGGKCN